jgi:peptidoglycan/LPS O-acetylase OafA/YrhL
MSASAPTALRENARPAPAGFSHTNGSRNPSPTIAKGPAGPRRFYELDLLRFVAAIAVVAFHYCFRASVEDPAFADTGFTDPHGVFRYGYLGVDLFFVISGFVILNSAWNKPASAFVASRIARLYPAFWVACTVTAMVMALDPNGRFQPSVQQWLVNLTMAPALFDVAQIDGVYWTLLVELKFYVLVLALCLLGMTTNRVLGFAVGWLAVSIWHTVDPLPDALAELLVPEWSAYFVAGILFALISREGWRVRYVVPLIAACAWAIHVAVEFAARQSSDYNAGLSPYVVAGIDAAIFGVFALIASHRLRIPGAARLAFLGALTYPVYLLHQNIGFVLFELGKGALSRWALAAAVLSVILALAWALHTRVEQRFAGPLARWLRGRLARLGVARAGVQHVEEAQRRRWSVVGAAPASGLSRVL